MRNIIQHRINRMELKTNISVVIILLVHTISHHTANKKTLSSCKSFFVVSGVRKSPIARSILAVIEFVLKFRTVNFLANHNF